MSFDPSGLEMEGSDSEREEDAIIENILIEGLNVRDLVSKSNLAVIRHRLYQLKHELQSESGVPLDDEKFHDLAIQLLQTVSQQFQLRRSDYGESNRIVMQRSYSDPTYDSNDNNSGDVYRHLKRDYIRLTTDNTPTTTQSDIDPLEALRFVKRRKQSKRRGAAAINRRQMPPSPLPLPLDDSKSAEETYMPPLVHRTISVGENDTDDDDADNDAEPMPTPGVVLMGFCDDNYSDKRNPKNSSKLSLTHSQSMEIGTILPSEPGSITNSRAISAETDSYGDDADNDGTDIVMISDDDADDNGVSGGVTLMGFCDERKHSQQRLPSSSLPPSMAKAKTQSLCCNVGTEQYSNNSNNSIVDYSPICDGSNWNIDDLQRSHSHSHASQSNVIRLLIPMYKDKYPIYYLVLRKRSQVSHTQKYCDIDIDRDKDLGSDNDDLLIAPGYTLMGHPT